MDVFIDSPSFYYIEDDFQLLCESCFTALKNIKQESIDMIFADPPDFLSGGMELHVAVEK